MHWQTDNRMNKSSDSDLIKPIGNNPTLDEALEYCVLALERGDAELETLPAKFPAWESEIEEFLVNWGGLEQLAIGLSDSLELANSLEMDEVLPADFGDFELLQKIGAGGMGSIYKARQKSLDRLVAIKILRRDPDEVGRFRLEAEATAALSHPNIVAIYEVGITAGKPWLCMQYVAGVNLKQYIDNHVIAPDEAARITRTIALGVSHAHQRGILHRDLKPANVLMDSQQQPYVTDFGLAKLIKSDTDATQSGTILGTPGYMSPEQASGKVRFLTVATDVYGLGALLYALLTGEAPFTGDSSIQILRRVVEEPVTSPRFKNTAVDSDLETLCLKCLEKSPELRYHSAEALAEDLGRYLDGQPVLARPVSSSERFMRWCQRNPAIAGLSGAVVVLILATTFFAAFLAWSERNSRVLVEGNVLRETILRKEAVRAYEEERTASRETLKTQINLLTANALWQAKNQNVGEALLWFTEAAGLSVDDAEQTQRLLINFQTWLNHHPFPVAAMLLPAEYCNIEDPDAIRFHPDNGMLLYNSRGAFVVWDYTRNRLWHLKELLPNLTSAIWGADGKSILAGCRDGQIVSIDADKRRRENILQANGSVSRLVLLDQNRKLGVVSGKKLSVFDLASREPVGETIEFKDTIFDATTNSDGSRLVCTDNSRTATVYEAGPGGIKKIREHSCSFYSLVDGRRSFWPMFIKNDKALLVRTAENNVTAFDLETGDSLGRIEFTFPIHSYSLSADGEIALSGGFNQARLLRLGEIEPVESVDDPRLTVALNDQVPHEDRVSAVSVGQNGLFATGGWNNEVRLWRSRTPQSPLSKIFDQPERVIPLAVLPHQNRLRRIQFSPDGRVLVTLQIDGLVRLWKVPDFQLAGTLLKVEPGGSLVKRVDVDRWLTSGISQWSGHMENATAHYFSDGTFAGGTVDQSRSAIGHLLDSACSPDGRQLATVHAKPDRTMTTPGSLRFWTMPDSQPIGQPIPLPSEPRWVAYRPDGRQLAVCTSRLEIILVNTHSLTVEGTIDSYGSNKKRLAKTHLFAQNPINDQATYTPDGTKLVVWSSRKRGIGVWDVETRSLKFPAVHLDQPPLAGISISPDGKHLATAGGPSAVVTILDLATGVVQKQQFPHPSFVHSVEFSPDGNLIVTGCRDGHARVFDWRSGDIRLDQLSHDADIVAATMTPDSRFVLTLGLDNQMRVWHMSDGSLAAKPITVPASSMQLLVSSDSRHVVVAGGHVLNIDLGELHREPANTLPRARQISELLANKTIVNGKPHSLSAHEWMTRWQAFESK